MCCTCPERLYINFNPILCLTLVLSPISEYLQALVERSEQKHLRLIVHDCGAEVIVAAASLREQRVQ